MEKNQADRRDDGRPTFVRLSGGQRQAVEQLAQREGRSISNLIRQMVREALRARGMSDAAQ